MNEDLKNIETCLPESVLAEVASVPTDPQFVSLVNESLDPLKQQAADREGWDAYNEVVKSHQPYTFTSPVRQMKSNLILLLRRFWRFPFGSGTLRSLSDMWQHYITRLQGSETYGIPSRLSQLTDLPSAPLLVADRKISGVPDAADGISVLNLLSNGSNIKVYDDSDQAYPLKDGVVNTLLSILPIETLTLGMRTASGNHCVVGNGSTANTTLKGTVNFANLEEYGRPNADGQNGLIKNCPNVDTVLAEKLHSIKHYARNEGDWQWAVIGGMAGLKCIKFGDFDEYSGTWTGGGNFIINCPKLIDLRFKSLSCSLNLKYWIPDETVLDGGDNLQQFLQNFRSFIVLRLANRKSTTALTLTLSANVYNAVTGASSGWASQHTLAELGITDNDLTDLETELGITSATIYATWLDTYTGANGIHWDINKAN